MVISRSILLKHFSPVRRYCTDSRASGPCLSKREALSEVTYVFNNTRPLKSRSNSSDWKLPYPVSIEHERHCLEIFSRWEYLGALGLFTFISCLKSLGGDVILYQVLKTCGFVNLCYFRPESRSQKCSRTVLSFSRTMVW